MIVASELKQMVELAKEQNNALSRIAYAVEALANMQAYETATGDDSVVPGSRDEIKRDRFKLGVMEDILKRLHVTAGGQEKAEIEAVLNM